MNRKIILRERSPISLTYSPELTFGRRIKFQDRGRVLANQFLKTSATTHQTYQHERSTPLIEVNEKTDTKTGFTQGLHNPPQDKMQN